MLSFSHMSRGQGYCASVCVCVCVKILMEQNERKKLLVELLLSQHRLSQTLSSSDIIADPHHKDVYLVMSH